MFKKEVYLQELNNPRHSNWPEPEFCRTILKTNKQAGTELCQAQRSLTRLLQGRFENVYHGSTSVGLGLHGASSVVGSICHEK